MQKPIRLDEQTWEAMGVVPFGADDLADPAMAHSGGQNRGQSRLGKLVDRIEQVDAKSAPRFMTFQFRPICFND